MMNSKLIGGILLIVGTTIGAGMLALPVTTAELGFWTSVALLVSCWAVMTFCAFLFLEVNLWMPKNANMISMVGATLGRPGQIVAWVAYLVLLYSILSAYVAGGGDLFQYVLQPLGIKLPEEAASILFTLMFGVIVYFGIRAVDYANRFLMFGKMGSYLLVVLLTLPFISSVNLHAGAMNNLTFRASLSVTTVAFTCLMIIPSLRTYFGEDVQSLRKAIFYGTLIPLLCYIAWDAIVMGIIPLDGTPGLRGMADSSNSNSGFVSALETLIDKKSISKLINFFTCICMATSFLSVSLSLSDVLTDGFNLRKEGIYKFMIYAGTFLPPLIIVMFFPKAFIEGLKVAGISCFILMILFPPLMVWRGRYATDLGEVGGYQVQASKFILGLLILFGAVMIGLGILNFL